MSEGRRRLPAVGTLADSALVRARCAEVPRTVVVDAVRAVVARARAEGNSVPASDAEWVDVVVEEVQRRMRPSLRPVINATGVVLHTNLGRAPLAPAAIDAIVETAGRPSNLEYDLDAGARGSRYTHCVELLRELTSADDALVVNNCAAALVLALNTVADGKEALVSRGELIEIGGSFRVPDIMAKSGTTLREVGTTNRTHLDDYRRALADTTGAIVKVHRSNFEQRGFVAEASLSELAVLATERRKPLVYDFGSGLLLSLEPYGLRGEPTASDGIRDGATLLVMSGDKMLGGPQAGIILGTRDAVEACRRNPLCRALRVDKLTIAALTATLALYRDPERAVREIPALAMLTAPAEELRARATAIANRLASAGVGNEVVPTEASVGGGAFPTARLSSWGVALGTDVVAVEQRLRALPTPVVARIDDGRLIADVRSVARDDDSSLAQALLAAALPSASVVTTAPVPARD